MKNIRHFALLLAFCAAMVMCFADYADARRMGGGRSFGSSSSMQRSFSAPKQSTKAPSGSQSAFNQSSAQKQGTNAAATPQRSGMFGGMGGMLGGLLAGGLIGSMLFGGGGMGMGGGFGGLLDIILLGAVAYFAFRFFARRKQNNAEQATAGAYNGGQSYQSQQSYQPQQDYNTHSYDNAQASGWDNLRSEPKSGPIEEPHGPEIPDGFDSEDFLRGAKLVFTRLQQSWDRRDIDDIALFATPYVVDEIRTQAKSDPEPSVTEILLVNANILSVKEEAGQQRATVFFDVLMREDPKQDVPTSVREVWHFTRPADAHTSAMWLLDGIQQVEQ